MATKRAQGVPCPDPFILEANTIDWLAKRYPQVDPEIAAERYVFWAVEFLYANHQRAFQNFVTREADLNRLGPMLKKSQPTTAVNEWPALEAEGLRVGFRKRIGNETPAQFKAALEAFGRAKANRVLQLLPTALKRA